MDTSKIYDIVGIGIGPFNLGLAALLQDHPHLNTLFIDQQPSFNWHPGLLLPGARMQVPFYADLVTGANPRSAFTFMNYLVQTGQVYRFTSNDNPFPLRIEYNRYCQWVVAQLPNLRFSYRCEDISWSEKKKLYTVYACNATTGKKLTFYTKHLVIGIGTSPHIPHTMEELHHPYVIHSGDYLHHKHAMLATDDITIIGSGQSAAEIFYDLLQHHTLLNKLHWFTRADRLFPMDDSKFALEMSTPNYIDQFYQLPKKTKEKLLAGQHDLYKGINRALIGQIYEYMYEQEINGVALQPAIRISTELHNVIAGKNLTLQLRNTLTGNHYEHSTKAAILATGYEYTVPGFLDNIREQINWTATNEYVVNQNYSIDNHNTIFVQNADLHSHGFNSADLGLGPYRNGVMLSTVLPNYQSILRQSDFNNLKSRKT